MSYIFMLFTYLKKKKNVAPGLGAAGIQVDSGQVKNLNFLFEELEINL